ncbi:hypothetical protein [Paenibacillus polymyxa]|uniref:hypothetical protein n=1 Tax=Paenibacillus polymyxa TaxID=1406 RepID=UPI002ED2798D|nr:hypothetical protein [Paenibacillus polymyxa]
MAQPNHRLIQTRQNTERGMGLTETRGVICFKHGVQIKQNLWIYVVNMLIPYHTLTFFRDKGAWYTIPQKGDYAFFHNDTRICHIGWVEKVIDNDTVQTIEGNTGNGSDADGGQVQRRKRSISGTRSLYIAGFGRPAYVSG